MKMRILFIALLSVLTTESMLCGEPNRDVDAASPEIYLSRSRQSVCVLRADVLGGNNETRRRSIVDFVSKSYEYTRHWKNHFAVAGIDYIRFSNLRIIAFDNCKAAYGSIRPFVGRFFDVDKLVVERSSSLVSTLDALHLSGNVQNEFNKWHQSSDLAKCLLGFRVQDENRFFDAKNGYDGFGLIRAKYRIPIFDLTWRGSDFFILFGRQCDRKYELYQEVVRLGRLEGLELDDMVRAQSIANVDRYLEIARSEHWGPSLRK